MGAKVCCTSGVMQTIILKAGWWFFYTGYSVCTRVTQTKFFSPCIKTKSSFNWFWIANAGIELQKHWWAVAGGGEKLWSILNSVIFVKQHHCDSMYIRSVHLRTGILYMIVFMFWDIEEKKKSTLESSKSPISHRWCPGHVGLCPALTLLHEGHDAHQFFLIVFWYKLEHFVFSLTGVVLP